MTTRIDTYAAKETAIKAIRFGPGDNAFRLAYRFTHGKVFKYGDDAVLMEGHDAKRVKVEAGDYIVKVNGGALYRFTPSEMEEHYLRVEES